MKEKSLKRIYNSLSHIFSFVLFISISLFIMQQKYRFKD